jgi:hypothetical protein
MCFDINIRTNIIRIRITILSINPLAFSKVLRESSAPAKSQTATHSICPAIVSKEKTRKFIFAIPAGIVIIDLINGIHLHIKTRIFPFSTNKKTVNARLIRSQIAHYICQLRIA